MKVKGQAAILLVCALVLVAAAAVGLWLWLKSSLRHEVYHSLERIERDSKGAVKVEAEDVSVAPIRRQATLQKVRISLKPAQGEPLALAADTLDVKKWMPLSYGGGLLREQALEWHNLTSPQLDSRLVRAPASVKKLTGESLAFDLSHSMRYRPEQENAFDLDAKISCARLGQIALHLAMTGVDLKQLNRLIREQQARAGSAAPGLALQSSMLPAIAQARLREARLAVRNAGVVETIVALSAARDRLTLSEEQRKMRAQLQLKCGAASAEPWMKRLCPALTAFAENPKSLSLTLAPVSPVALSSLPVTALSRGPGAVMDQLGASLAANKEE